MMPAEAAKTAWRLASAAALLPLFAAVAPAAAPPAHPPFAPSRDVGVTYRLESPDPKLPGRTSTEELRFRAAAGGRRLRLDTSGSQSYLLIDPQAKSATVVDPALRAFMTVQLNPELARGLLLLDPAARYARTGTAKVAGLACTVWSVGAKGREGLVCVTGGGVILRRVQGSDQERSRLTALSVTYAPEPMSLFTPPHGYQDLSAVRAPAIPALPAGRAPGPTPPSVVPGGVASPPAPAPGSR